MFQDSRALVLAVAGGIALVVRFSPGEAMVRSKPDAVRRGMIGNPPDRAELFTTLHLIPDQARAGENVVVDDRNSIARLQRYPVRVAAFVDRRVGMRAVPVGFAVGLPGPWRFAFIADEHGSWWSSRDGQNAEVFVSGWGASVRHVAIRPQAIGHGVSTKARLLRLQEEEAFRTPGDPDVAAWVGGHSVDRLGSAVLRPVERPASGVWESDDHAAIAASIWEAAVGPAAVGSASVRRAAVWRAAVWRAAVGSASVRQPTVLLAAIRVDSVSGGRNEDGIAVAAARAEEGDRRHDRGSTADS